MTLDELILEWSYRTNKGYPCLDNPSDIKILKSLLESLNMPSNTIIGKLLEDEEDDDESYANKDGEPGIAGMEPENNPTSKEDLIKWLQDTECPITIDTIKQIRDINSNPTTSPKEKDKLKNRICSFKSYKPIRNLLKDKGYPEAEFSKFAKEIQDLTEDIDDKDRMYFINYINNPEKQSPFKPNQRGNLYDDIKETGIHPNIINDIVKHTTQDSGKKSVGMGELCLAIVFSNVGAAKGAGDLSLNNETFEIKGEGATLGKRPDAVNAINLDNIA